MDAARLESSIAAADKAAAADAALRTRLGSKLAGKQAQHANLQEEQEALQQRLRELQEAREGAEEALAAVKARRQAGEAAGSG
jgi:predicted  nucleic acid-binding Zn-ribbon protein